MSKSKGVWPIKSLTVYFITFIYQMLNWQTQIIFNTVLLPVEWNKINIIPKRSVAIIIHPLLHSSLNEKARTKQVIAGINVLIGWFKASSRNTLLQIVRSSHILLYTFSLFRLFIWLSLLVISNVSYFNHRNQHLSALLSIIWPLKEL